jgi:hypothetical protein
MSIRIPGRIPMLEFDVVLNRCRKMYEDTVQLMNIKKYTG